jgi:hypothetical protein
MSSFSSANPSLVSSNLELKDGTRVTLVGLKTDSMNGLTGTALRLAIDGERYVVRLDADGKSANIKPDNLVVTDGSNLEQLKSEAIGLEFCEEYEEALAKFEEVLVIQQRDLGNDLDDTHETLTSMDRCIDQFKYASVDNGDVAESALSFILQDKDNDAYLVHEQIYQRQLVTHGAEHPETLATLVRGTIWRCRC